MPSPALPHWELSVLSRAVAYPNLSGAAGNIGISQPQLSRIVARLEERLGTELLDRASRRKSGWTAAAHRLAEIYASSARALERQMRALAIHAERLELRIGTLEGLAPVATDLSHAILSRTQVATVALDVHDLHVLEELFAKDALDLVLVSRLPGRRKPRYARQLGYQTLERVSRPGRALVLSPYERSNRRDTSGREIPTGERLFVSNSLAVRRFWLERFGGQGVLPSELLPAPPSAKRAEAVYLVGSDTLPRPLWQRISAL
jgi:DNA-binding transcriptional LysR family regulator